MARAYFYVVDRDFGFAPNPFHGLCTLATCKPILRRVARVGDWIVGMGGGRLNATGRCIYAMRVTRKVSFSEYWEDPEFAVKKPVRNGSFRMLVGDNIYEPNEAGWIQLDSHHSNADGSVNRINLESDTSTDAVLVSHDFYYFGAEAPQVPQTILRNLGYRNGRHHRTFGASQIEPLLRWMNRYPRNQVIADPFDFSRAFSRYTGLASRIA